MPRILLPGALLILLLLGGLLTLNDGWLALALPLAVYLLAGFLQSPERLELEVERRLSTDRAVPGQPVTVTLTITNRGPRLPRLTLSDPLPGFCTVSKGSATRLASLESGATLHWEYSFTGQRGFHTFSHIQAEASDLLGILNIQASPATSGQITILPAAPRIRRVTIRPRVTRVYSGSIPAHQGGPGLDFFGVREYQPGDSPRAINWRAAARHPGAVFSNEFEQERVADVAIIIDARQKSYPAAHNGLFDAAISAGAAMAETFLASGNRVGLLVYGHYVNWNMPGYGKRQREEILQTLARAKPSESQVFAGLHISRRLFPAHSQLVFIGPIQPDDVGPLTTLRAEGYPLIVISPNALRIEAEALPPSPATIQALRLRLVERYITIRRLRHAGIQAIDWDIQRPLEQLAKPELQALAMKKWGKKLDGRMGKKTMIDTIEAGTLNSTIMTRFKVPMSNTNAIPTEI